MLPVTLGLGLININALIDGVIAAHLIDPELAPAAIDAAFRIYMLPQGMFSVAVATVLFPSLARFASRGDLAGFRSTVSLGLRQIAFLLVPASVVVGRARRADHAADLPARRVHARPDARSSRRALAAFSLGLTFNGTMLMLNRAFFSLQSNWIPTLVALGNLFVNAVLDVAFAPVGVWGIPLATSLVNIAGTAALLVLLRRRLERIDFGDVAARSSASSSRRLSRAPRAFGVWYPLDAAAGRDFVGQLASLVPALLVAGLIYGVSCRVLGVRELQAFRSLRRRRV